MVARIRQCTDRPTITPNKACSADIYRRIKRRVGCSLSILTWCTRNQVTLKDRHIPGWLNVVADKLSRLGQTIQTEWSLLPDMHQVAPAKNRPFCHEVQQQVASVCLTGIRIPGHSSGCTVWHGRILTHMPFHQQPSWAK